MSGANEVDGKIVLRIYVPDIENTPALTCLTHRSGKGPTHVAGVADVIRQAAEIYLKSSVPSSTENHCYKCDGNNLLHDALREKGVE